MRVFVDTSVWSLALRRDSPARVPEVELLGSYLERGDLVVTTGIVLQELLQGFQGPRAKKAIVKQLSLLPMIVPDIDDHVQAADLRTRCRRKGVQIGTIDALIARLCIRQELPLLTTDQNFKAVSRHFPLALVTGPYTPGG
jgi:predicted nucleic acid-binding protein